MKLLLKNSVRSLGRAGEVVNVKAGYARNYLLPQGKAILATDANIVLIDKFKARRVEEEAQLKESYQKTAVLINETQIVLNLRANATNHLYGSVTTGDIVTQLNNRHIIIEKSMVQLAEPIKELGAYDIDIVLSSDVKAVLKLEILNEDGEIPTVEHIKEEKKQELETEETSQEETVA